MTTNNELLDALDKSTASSAKLRKQVNGLSTELAALSTYGRQNRRFIRLLVVSLVFDICLSLGLGALALNGQRTAEAASHASSALVVGCVSNNASNKTQKELWEFLFKFPPPPNETAPARAQRLKTTVQFKTYINKAFVQRKC